MATSVIAPQRWALEASVAAFHDVEPRERWVSGIFMRLVHDVFLIASQRAADLRARANEKHKPRHERPTNLHATPPRRDSSANARREQKRRHGVMVARHRGAHDRRVRQAAVGQLGPGRHFLSKD